MHRRKNRCKPGAPGAWVMCRPDVIGLHLYLNHFRKVRHASPAPTRPPRKKPDDGKITLKDRRFALEQEIAKLRKKFSQEEKVHKTLKKALQRPVGSLPRISQSLPSKIQKVLAEVAILEEEVVRLEDHVGYLRRELSGETSQLFSYVSQKQKFVSDQHFGKPSYLNRIRTPTESIPREVVPKGLSNALSAKEPSKSSTGLRKVPKSSHEAFHRQRSVGRERLESKASKLVVAVAPPSERAPSVCHDARRGAGGRLALQPGLPLSSSRRPPRVGEVLARLEGWQQPSTSGVAGGRGNPHNKQFSSLNWGRRAIRLSNREMLPEYPVHRSVLGVASIRRRLFP